MRYTIEARELTREHSRRPSSAVPPRPAIVEAHDADEAIRRYVRECHGELVSFIQPARGQEFIATVKKEDTVFLVRVSSA